jgi:hypothetical protein
MKVFCGIDWSERHHDVALVDQDGTLIAKRRIGESVEGFAELLTLLAEAGDSPEEPIPVAIETSRGLLVAALRATGRPIYAINPMAVARYRERHCVSRKKSDHVDAMTLANILRTDAHAHRRLPADSELAQAITVLARAAQDAIWRRTKAIQELRALLREFYPGFLAAFADGTVTNLASPGSPRDPGHRPDPGRRREAVPGPHRHRAAPRRSPTRHHHPGRPPPPHPAHPSATAARSGGKRHGLPGQRAAGHPGHRMRQRRPAHRRSHRGLHPTPRPPDHHQLPRPG